MLDAALAYARHGIPVLPVHTPGRDGACSCGRADCDRPGKHPRLRRGLTDATVDPRRIEMWWSRWPEANIGLRTGIVMDVADVDSAAGWHGLRHLLDGTLPAGPQVRTGGGGWHFWFTPLGYGNRVHLLPGVDWRGTGGYVVAPPSRHAEGTFYYWVVRPTADPPQAPEPLRGLIAGPDPPSTGGRGFDPATIPPPESDAAASPHPGRYWAASPHPERGAAPSPYPERGAVASPCPERGAVASPHPERGAVASPRPERGAAPENSHSQGCAAAAILHPERYAAAALEAETDRVAHAVVGTRNDTLNRAAFALGRLVGAGLLDASAVGRELTAAGAWAGLGRTETIRTIRSGLNAGRRSPLPLESRRPHTARSPSLPPEPGSPHTGRHPPPPHEPGRPSAGLRSPLAEEAGRARVGERGGASQRVRDIDPHRVA
ncbi:bifunctional DNA primase/polymerase-like protein [Pseudosporangium ferrugineum]|uniref:Bifunctional DNA primase/polymerase-like protein n=2 Tax=Pseudosporangium ferrugineum TaxID=439699 RepID=A0A2T0S394_9ACTN|nr:bifunctional DNA primase/polymerase-like protein [Pseudosporangium ferrugineum]